MSRRADRASSVGGVGAWRLNPPCDAVVLIVAVALMMVALMAGLPTPRPSAKTLAAVFPPWWSQTRILKAGLPVGDIAAMGAAPFVIVLHVRTASAEQTLRRAGALLVIDPARFGVCERQEEQS